MPAWAAAALLWLPVAAPGQTAAKPGEWLTYGGDLANSKYCPLGQINASNFSKLEVAWRFKTDRLATLTLGIASGGTNWPGGSYDPETHTVYTCACNACVAGFGVVPAPKEGSLLHGRACAPRSAR